MPPPPPPQECPPRSPQKMPPKKMPPPLLWSYHEVGAMMEKDPDIVFSTNFQHEIWNGKQKI